MAKKKPIWATTAAHAHLKEFCAAVGRTQLEVVSELILTQLDPANPQKASPPKPKAQRAQQGSENRHFGGVWVV